MRFLNMSQLSSIPAADTPMGSPADLAKRKQKAAQMKRALQARAHQQAQIEALAAHRELMTKQAMRMSGHDVAYARARQGSGHVAQYGIRNPNLGFVDEVPGATTDFSMHTAQPASEFCNGLAVKDLKYCEYQDFPLVLNSPAGDFSGILVNEAHSADFSERIFNDDRQDFGYTPRRPARRHRK